MAKSPSVPTDSIHRKHVCPKGEGSVHLDPFGTRCTTTIKPNKLGATPGVWGSPGCWQNTAAPGSAAGEILGENPPAQPAVSPASPQDPEVRPHHPKECLAQPGIGAPGPKYPLPYWQQGGIPTAWSKRGFETAPRTEKQVDSEKIKSLSELLFN